MHDIICNVLYGGILHSKANAVFINIFIDIGRQRYKGNYEISMMDDALRLSQWWHLVFVSICFVLSGKFSNLRAIFMIFLFAVPWRTDCGSEHLFSGLQSREQEKGAVLLALHFWHPP